MWLSVGQTLDLGNVEVGVYVGALVSSLGVVCQDTSARLESVMNFTVSFVYWDSTHGMNQDRSNPGLLEPGLEPPQNGLGPFEMVSISLEIPDARRQSSVWYRGQGAYDLENDIGSSSELFQVHNIVEGSKNGLESQFFKGLGLFGGAKVDGDIVLGPFWVLDELGEYAAANVAWVTISHMSNEHPARDDEA